MSEKEIINEIDANTCEWRTGIEHCGDYECMINKCCDLNCDWYKRRKLEQLLQAKEQECEELKDKLLRKRAVIEFADCPCYSYGDNTIEPTCIKNFCYDVKFCDYKDIVKLKQTLNEIKDIAEDHCIFCQKIDPETFDMSECKKCNHSKILQKISECEVK